MLIRYIGAMLIGLLFSSFYQAPALAMGSNSKITSLLDKNTQTQEKEPFITKKKVIIALLVLIAAGVITWGVYKTFIQSPQIEQLDSVVLPRNANNGHDIAVNFVVGDITQQNFTHPDQAAITNAANELMLGGGGIDGAIHRAAGPGLRAECARVPQVRPGVRCPTGEARITGGHNLAPVRIIHTVGPDIRGKAAPDAQDAQLLENVYNSVLQEATDNALREVAIPSISTGIFAYPLGDAADIAANTVREFVENNATTLDEVRLVLSDQATAQAYRAAFTR